jgi:putative peptidoglycan lipid II flippase
MATGILKNISALSLSTVGSRVLGLARDALFFASFGSNLISSAFIIAFTIPNLFRRLLGEGALSSAFVPVFNDALEHDRDQARQLLRQTLTRLGGGLFVFIALVTVGYFLFGRGLNLPDDWRLATPMLFLMLPYAGLICCAAILTAALNSLNRFVLPSLSPIILNLAMIGTLLGAAHGWGLTGIDLAYALCVGVLVGGVMQFLLPAIELRTLRWKLTPDFSQSQAFEQVCHLFWSASGAAAAIQINLLVTRIIAFQVSDAAVSQLYIASRITEFPLGIFTIAITTVLFPKLARLVSQKKHEEFQQTAQGGLSLILAITLPAAAGIYLLSGPIISLLFQWGRFGEGSVEAATPVLEIYALSIPILSIVGYFTKILHAQRKMPLALRITLLSILTNIGLCLTLAKPFGVTGLAWASVMSAFLQMLLLSVFLGRGYPMQLIWKSVAEIGSVLVACIPMVTVVWISRSWLQETSERWLLALQLSTIILGSALIYAILAWLLRLHKKLDWLESKD